MIRHHIEHLFGQSHPLTTHEDRVRLWYWAGIFTAAILLGLAFCGPSMAQEYGYADDSRPRANSETTSHHRAAHRAARKRGVRAPRASRNSVDLVGIVPPLATKAREIMGTCGSKVVSAIRRGARVYGGSASNHASGRAVDLQGNPSCIYAHLHSWPGGYSTDYAIAPGGPHVHVSYNPGGMEWGLRFAHHSPFGSLRSRKAVRQ
jgi:hypothetical protein